MVIEACGDRDPTAQRVASWRRCSLAMRPRGAAHSQLVAGASGAAAGHDRRPRHHARDVTASVIEPRAVIE
jgi:hypothetical protein